MCKHGNVFSLAVLIGRGLDHNPSWFKIALSSPLNSCFSFIQFSGYIKPTGYTNVYPVFCYIENVLLLNFDLPECALLSLITFGDRQMELKAKFCMGTVGLMLGRFFVLFCALDRVFVPC